MHYTIGQFAALTQLSSYTLRYYEKEELLQVGRDAVGRRRYTDADIAWLQFIKRLKETGMSIHNIRSYARLRYQGDATLAERLTLLEQHKLSVVEEKLKWEQNLVKLEEKISLYKKMIDDLQEIQSPSA
ncbi:MerR family transcriptional regulator [Azotosporobacter soli]|uniref:MerR family transcriptional regulator n=1 Tax=Azotosporobacter soli TaxID=3055040 RepID=UPI0031FF34D0